MRFRITLSEERNNFLQNSNYCTNRQYRTDRLYGQLGAIWATSASSKRHLPQGTPSWGLPAIPNYVRRRGSAIPITLWCAEPPRRLGGGCPQAGADFPVCWTSVVEAQDPHFVLELPL
jgi:hypothetical protein